MHQTIVYSKNSPIKKVLERVDLIARSEFPVLLIGETGVGKELFAQRIHLHSVTPPPAPFVPVNCGALPPGLMESELFGHEKGAFSGAVQASRGLVRSAAEGTIFLDEIGELDPTAQVKMLRWLDCGEIRSLGSSKTETVKCRLVSATNVNLFSAVGTGAFRRDLLERISTFTIHIPPLRDRKEDILPISLKILGELACQVDPATLQLLELFEWPGNVRQLRKVLLRAYVFGEGKITEKLLRDLLYEEALLNISTVPTNIKELFERGKLEEIENHVIVDRLSKNIGNCTATARELGIAKSTLHEKLKKNNIVNIWRKRGSQPSRPPVLDS